MIQPQTFLKVADNSGAKKLQCIRIPGSKKNSARVGDVIVGVVKEALPNLTVKRKQIVRAIVIRTRQGQTRRDGFSLCFTVNASVIIDKNGTPLGTRIFGPLAREVKENSFSKVASLASYII